MTVTKFVVASPETRSVPEGARKISLMASLNFGGNKIRVYSVQKVSGGSYSQINMVDQNKDASVKPFDRVQPNVVSMDLFGGGEVLDKNN